MDALGWAFRADLSEAGEELDRLTWLACGEAERRGSDPAPLIVLIKRTLMLGNKV